MKTPVTHAITRSVITLPPKTNAVLGRGSAVAFSPDGTRIAYVAASADRVPRLYLRALNQLESTVIPDTDGAANPFFSPDSRWVAMIVL